MSQISLKSISGITSITTPAGVDNQFTLHTNNTSQALKLDSAGNIHIHNHLNTTGVSSASNFKTGSSNLHSAGLSAASIDVGSNIKLGNAGVITATSFVGSGAALTGIDATAIKDSGGNVKIQAQASGAIHTGVSTFNQINLEDDKYLKLGTGNDFQFYHLASDNNSYIKETGSGSLMIQGDVVNIGSPTSGEYYIRAFENADVQIRYNNSTKIQTTNTGAVVTGILTATTFKGILVPTTYAGGRRNMFINGEFAINQRGDRDPHANQNNGANNLQYGGPDHVQVVKNIGSYTAKQANEHSSPRTQAGGVTSYELDVTATGSNATAGYTFLNFMWNGHEANRLMYGTSSARPITISFWCQCNLTGTFGINLRNYGSDRMISQALTISSANTWEYKTVTFVGDTSAALSVTINAALAMEIWLAAGSNYNSGGTQSTWASRNDTRRSAGTNINIASNTSNYFRISLLQVEMGEYATPFEFRTYGEYLHDCEYYFQKPYSSRASNQPFAIHTWGHKVADTYALRVQTMMRPTEMRINPTDYFHDNNPSGLTAQRYQIQGADYEYTYNVGMSIGSNKKEFANGTKYPYGVNGMGAGESGILWAYDFESYAEL